MQNGTPTKVSDKNKVSVGTRQLTHGSTGSQGGDRGNDYQALWMTLACLNAIYSPEPNLREIILEGSHEPYDDVEMRKIDGSFTFFQSKHRDRSSSNNITIAELTAPATGKKTTAFSLPKYFKGMMAEYEKGTDLDKVNFVIGVSANFSGRFKQDDEYVILEENTWTTEGILQRVEEQTIDPLLCNIAIRGESVRSISDYLAKKHPSVKPVYVRFSDDFIAGKNLTHNQRILRRLIMDALNTVASKLTKKPPKSRALFLRKLQFWINQPKLEVLQDIVRYSLNENFSTGIDTIHQQLFTVMKKSAQRGSKSFSIDDIMTHLKAARGVCLAQQLRVHDDLYQEAHLMRLIATKGCLVNKELLSFISSKENYTSIITSKDYNNLKYTVAATLKIYADGNLSNDEWCIVNANTKPIYHQHQVKGYIDHGIEDLVSSQQIKIIALDNVGSLLLTDQGRQQLLNLSQKNKVKLILLCDFADLPVLMAEMPHAMLIHSNRDYLDPPDMISLVQQTASEHKYVTVYNGLTRDAITMAEKPWLQKVICSPTHLKSFILSYSRDETGSSADQFAVAHYQAMPLPDYQPYYNISDLLDNAGVEKLCLWDVPASVQQYFFDEKKGFRYSKNKKHLYMSMNSGTGTLYLEHYPQKGKDCVLVTGYNASDEAEEQAINSWSCVVATGFKKNAHHIEPKTLLAASDGPQRSLIVADYGTGKTSLQKYFFNYWLQQSDKSYFFAIPCQLCQVVEGVQQQHTHLEIMLDQLQRQGLLSSNEPEWLRGALESALTEGGIILLLDQWDELHHSQYALMDDWLKALPQGVSFILTSRPHAVNHLSVSFHHRLSLDLFGWDNIVAYIQAYFHDIEDGFVTRLLEWLEEGEAEHITDILSRPLHLTLLLHALQPYTEQYRNAPDKQAVLDSIPWYQESLYRTKLYQIIIRQQLNKYLTIQLGATLLPRLSGCSAIQMLTQTHQIFLRQIAFKLIFDEAPISLVTSIDEALVIQELYDLGILADRHAEADGIKFVYRIFSEYFAAQYLLNALLRGKDDFVCKHAIEIITKYADNPEYEQIWRVLGEMIRYGEPLLNHHATAIDEFKAFSCLESDLLGSYFCYIDHCLRGKPFTYRYDYEVTHGAIWFDNDVEDEQEQGNHVVEDDEQPVEKRDEFLFNHLLQAQASKRDASKTINKLVSRGLMTDAWLYCFYYKGLTEKVLIEKKAGVCKQLRETIPRTLENLKQKVEKMKWPEEAWGNYWDVDVYMPIIKSMHPQLFLMGAAYFIHRVENKNNVYYNSQIPSTSIGVLAELLKHPLDEDSNRLFYMMVLIWLRKPTMISTHNTYSKGFVPRLLDKIFTTLESHQQDLQLLSINTLFALSRVFNLRLNAEEHTDNCHLCVKAPENTMYHYEVSQESYRLLSQQLSGLRSRTDFNEQRLVRFELDGSNLSLLEDQSEPALCTQFSGMALQ